MQVSFEGEIIYTQYCIENKRFGAYFPKHRFWIEVDEYNHEGRNSEYEQSRQFMIESVMELLLLGVIQMMKILTWVD